MLGLYEVFVFTRRPLWFMIFGGVFDRHPNLRVVVTENGVQWLPSLIRDMESFFDTHGGAPVRSYLKMRPSRVLREARVARRLADEALRGRDAPRDRDRQAHVGGGLPAPGGRGARRTARRCATSSAGSPRTSCARSSAATPWTCGASTPHSCRRWPTGWVRPSPTWRRRSSWPTSRTRSAGAWPGRCRWRSELRRSVEVPNQG